MKYRCTVLTPLLIGDGQGLSPIDYMVWKDQVNVLDQRRIFRLLAKGPRLDGYLAQLKKAEKLDFASWGGFAQNFAGRRIPFEHPSSAAYWERARSENLHIPTFASGPQGPYLPGSAVKGALRSGMLFTSWKEGRLPSEERMPGERISRSGGPANVEVRALGAPGENLMRAVSVGDSGAVPATALKIYLLRVATLVSHGPGRYELGWKQAPRGSVDARRVEESTPQFAEMAAPGTEFEGPWRENSHLSRKEVLRALDWAEPVTTATLMGSANRYAAEVLRLHRRYAAWAGLALVDRTLVQLEARLEEARAAASACLLVMGWGGGLLSKTGWPDTEQEDYRRLLRESPVYGRVLASGLPFPKTRRIVFLNNQPAVLPGWVWLEIMG
jgi:CRISPR-associated protein Csm5